MNQDKAREFFSAFYEGTLEPGLKQSLETRFRADSVLRADYAAFVATMGDLGRLAEEEIELPVYLSDRIASRLEQEKGRRKLGTPTWAIWLRGLGFAGLGAAAIAGAILSLRPGGRGATASAISSVSGDQPTFSASGSTVALNYRPSAAKTVVVLSAVSGRELERFVVDSASPVHTFANKLPGTAIFQIQVLGENPSYYLALPGASNGDPATSPGTIRDFAVALAGRYRVPVVLHASDTTKRLAWKLDGLDPELAAGTALAGEPFVVDQRESGVISIGDR